MCGICGIAIPGRLNRSVDRARLERMRDTLAHRGPDDADLFIAGPVGLGHRRLSIVDLSGGRQPMPNEDASVWIAFNGEIYNHADLRPTLQARGHTYSSASDTETIIHLYEEFGAHAVDHLRGMFSFAIWDQKERRLLLARDRLGVKPLYYVLTDEGAIFFASEIKALLAAGAIKPELNYDALSDYAANRATSGEQTLFRGVKRLLPGHTLVWRDGRVELSRYWDISFANGCDGLEEESTEEDYIAQFYELFRESVNLRLMSDVPLGVFLSGGLDSSAIAAVMSSLVEDPIKTFSVAFAEREGNELEYARLVSRSFGTEHHEITIKPGQFFAALPPLVYQEDEPIAHPSSIPLYFVSKLAARYVKVVLTGEGSDELLAGYNRYRTTVYQVPLARAYRRLVASPVRRLVKGLLESGRIGGTPGRKLSRTFLCLSPDLHEIYFDNFSVFSRAMQQRLFTPEARERISPDPYQVSFDCIERSLAESTLDRLLAADLKTYLHELLMKQDQMSMAASIESRVPFLDHKLVEFAVSLPANMKLRGVTTKYILRRAMKGRLPEAILSRKKMGFPVPLGKWLRGQYSHLLDEYVLGERALQRGIFDPAYVRTLVARHRAGEDHEERLWTLMNFEIWQRRFIDGESEVANPGLGIVDPGIANRGSRHADSRRIGSSTTAPTLSTSHSPIPNPRSASLQSASPNPQLGRFR